NVMPTKRLGRRRGSDARQMGLRPGLPSPASIRVLGTCGMKTQNILESSHHAVPATIDAAVRPAAPFCRLRLSRVLNASRPRRLADMTRVAVDAGVDGAAARSRSQTSHRLSNRDSGRATEPSGVIH